LWTSRVIAIEGVWLVPRQDPHLTSVVKAECLVAIKILILLGKLALLNKYFLTHLESQLGLVT
jgi:hypothetical protein